MIITSAASWEYRFGWGTHIAFDPAVGVELLPVNTKVRVSYLGASVEKQQNTKVQFAPRFQYQKSYGQPV
jgi:hypothetical protein